MIRTTLSIDTLAALERELDTAAQPEEPKRRPVHTVYGGAHLFTAGTIGKLSSIAQTSLAGYAPDSSRFAEIFGLDQTVAVRVRELIEQKLATEAVEDFRIDFEDGYGVRSGTDEDEDAVSAAVETAKSFSNQALPAFFGIRVKALNADTGKRALHTLDIFLTKLVEITGKLPDNFVVTLPKINSAAELSTFCRALGEIEQGLGLDHGTIHLEIMVETARSLLSGDGTIALQRIVKAADGRCAAAHFGAYDYLSELGVAASEQQLRHPACDLARNIMKLSLADSAVDLSDGATNLMPVPKHRGDDLSPEQENENRIAVESAWRLHYDNIRHGLASGFYRGWDLHPAQFVARYAAVYSFFLGSAPEASVRLRGFIEKGARANLVGNTFDDAATGQGLLNFFRRAIDCGALHEDEAAVMTGLSPAELRTRTFAEIIGSREQPA